MLKIENFEEFNVVRAVYSARNALNSWDKSSADAETNDDFCLGVKYAIEQIRYFTK